MEQVLWLNPLISNINKNFIDMDVNGFLRSYNIFFLFLHREFWKIFFEVNRYVLVFIFKLCYKCILNIEY